MPEENHAYGGSRIVIRSDGASRELLIDGEPMPFTESGGSEPFWSPVTPYVQHRSLLDLAKALVHFKRQ